jgi:hypothetical protein
MSKDGFIVLSTIVILVAVLLIFSAIGVGAYNRAITLEENIGEATSSVDVARIAARNKLEAIEDSIEVGMSYYQEIIDAIATARSNDWDVEQVGVALNVIMEAYPDPAVAPELIRDQLTEIAFSHNAIRAERDSYNNLVKEYNVHFRKFPNNIILNIMGLEKQEFSFIEFSDEIIDGLDGY